MSKVFLSHSSKDKFIVRKIATQLKSYGVDVWLDEAELNVGDSLTEKIGEAIDFSDYICVFLSNNSIQSEWVQQELKVAIQREIQEKNVIVLPILLDRVDIPPFLRDKKYADFTSQEKFEEEFKKLLRVFGKNIESIEIQSSEVVKTIKNVDVNPAMNKYAYASEKTLMEFDDIKMVEINNNRSYKPDNDKALYNIYIDLSDNPSPEWQQIFEAERKFPRHNMWRKAWVESGSIVIHCVPNEMRNYHLGDLKDDVKNTNVKYREYMAEMLRREQESDRSQQNEAKKFDDSINNLDFS